MDCRYKSRGTTEVSWPMNVGMEMGLGDSEDNWARNLICIEVDAIVECTASRIIADGLSFSWHRSMSFGRNQLI